MTRAGLVCTLCIIFLQYIPQSGHLTVIYRFLFVLNYISYIYFIFFVFFAISLGRSCGIWRFPGSGSNRSYSPRPTPEPQQRRIRASSATYTTAYIYFNGNLLTWLKRPGKKACSFCVSLHSVQSPSYWKGSGVMGVPVGNLLAPHHRYLC